MKKLLLPILLTAVVAAHSCASAEKLIERPAHGLKNTTTLEIDKIVLTDTATIFYVDVFFQPKYWIRVDGKTYIRAGGEKFYVTGAEGIKLDDYHWIPESGEDSFRLFFPPLTKGTKTVDFIESDCDECFKIWDIDLTGRRKYKADIPDDMLRPQEDKSAPLPPVELTQGLTTVNVKFTGLREGYVIRDEPRIIINDLFLGQQREIEPTGESVVATSAGQGETVHSYTFEFTQNGTTGAWLAFDQRGFMDVLLAPGEQVGINVDLSARSAALSRYSPDENIKYAGFSGRYAALNARLAAPRLRNQNSGYDDDPAILDMTPLQWAELLRATHDEAVKSIEAQKDLSVAFRELLLLRANMRYGDIITDVTVSYMNAYADVHGMNWDQVREVYKAPTFTPELAGLLEPFDFSNPQYLYIPEYSWLAQSLAFLPWPEGGLDSFTGSDSGLLHDLRAVAPIMAEAEALEPLTDFERKRLESASVPLFREVFFTARAEAQQAYEEALAKGGYTIKETPKVSADKIVEAIIGQHKGKPVFIDFWATWCGPCLGGMQAIKPFKPEMKEKGVVTVYITDDSSPKAKWLPMLADLGGEHYYLTHEQYTALRDKYGFNGIPTYMIADKEGNIVYQTTGFPGVAKFRSEFSKVW